MCWVYGMTNALEEGAVRLRIGARSSGRHAVTHSAYRPLAIAALAGAVLFGASAPSLAAKAKPQLHVKVNYRAATDDYCINMSSIEGPRTGSLLPDIECKSRAAWGAEGLTISRD